jgi:hypothetical protein
LCFSRNSQRAIVEINDDSFNMFSASITMTPVRIMVDQDVSHVIIEESSPFLVDISMK